MTLDECRKKWLEYDRKLDSVIRLNHELLNDDMLSKARSALRLQTVFATAGAVVNWLAIPLVAVFIAMNHSSLKFVIPALIVDLYFIANMAAHVRQARALGSISYGEPVTVIQKQIEAVVQLRIRFSRWLALTLVLSWVPISIVLFKGLFGWDLYVLAPQWLIVNTVAGLACFPLVLWLSKKSAAAAESPHIQRFARDIAGTNLNAARSFLETLAEFERDGNHRASA